MTIVESGRWPRTTAGACTARRAGATSPAPSPSRRVARRASTRPRSNGCCDRRSIVPEPEVVLYGDGPTTPSASRAGWPSSATRRPHLRGRLGGWAADETLPVERLPQPRPARPHRTGSAQLLAGGRPEAAPTGHFLLFHVNFGVPEEYAEDHLPGALYLDTNWLEDPVDWNRRSPEELDADAARARHHPRHDGHPLRPRHRGRRQREVAGPPGRADRAPRARR